MLKRSKRIHGRDTVACIVKGGERTPGRFFTIIRKSNDAECNHYAVVVGKKIEKSAAKRNRKRRQINEAIRLLEQAKELSSGPYSDIVVLVKHAGLTASFEELKNALSPLV